MDDINLAKLLYEIVSFSIVFILGSIWGVSIIKRKQQQSKVDKPDEDTKITHVSMPVCVLRVEHVDGLMLFYSCEDDSFLCQGATLDESAKNFCTNTKNEFVGMTVVDGKKFVFHDYECLPVLESK